MYRHGYLDGRRDPSQATTHYGSSIAVRLCGKLPGYHQLLSSVSSALSDPGECAICRHKDGRERLSRKLGESFISLHMPGCCFTPVPAADPPNLAAPHSISI